MMRLGAIFWLMLVLAAGFTTFKTKYAIQDLEDELAKVRKQTTAEQQEIRVLTAEWTFLNQPERLAELNKRFLNLGPVGTKQLQQRIEDIPLRTPPATEGMDELVASVEGAAPAAAIATTAAVVTASAVAAPAAAAPVPMPTPTTLAAAPVAPPPTTTPPKAVVATAITPVAKAPAAPRVQLAKASPPPTLDSLIAKLVEVH